MGLKSPCIQYNRSRNDLRSYQKVVKSFSSNSLTMESCLEGYNVYVFILLAVSLFLYWPGMFVNKHYDEYERIQKPRNGNDRVGLATLNGHKLVCISVILILIC